MKITIATGEKVSVELGGLVFEVLRRDVGDDGGHSIEVYGAQDRDTQVLRFDVFRVDPHYHMPPSAKGQLSLADVADPMEWALEQTRENLPEMIRKAGFDALADSLDTGAFKSGWTAVRDAIDSAAEPTETQEFDVDPALLQ